MSTDATKPTDTLERIAEALHEGWRKHRTDAGCVLGDDRTESTHPHLLPWGALDRASQNQDRFVAAVVLDAWFQGRLGPGDLPKAIHEAWRRWVTLQGRQHHHARPYEEVHPTDADDHAVQARLIEPLLRSMTRG